MQIINDSIKRYVKYEIVDREWTENVFGNAQKIRKHLLQIK